MMHVARFLLGPAFRAQLRKSLDRTLHAAKFCQKIQEQTLLRLLQLNGDSQFSQKRGLQRVRTVSDFRDALPLGNYDQVAEEIERLKNGETQALLGSRNRLLMFALTSGTTNASKFIPVTQQFVNDYRRGWQDWGICAIAKHPTLRSQPYLQLCSSHDRFRTPGGIPCGNISGLVQAMQNPLVRSMYTVPAAALKITETSAKYYFALKHSVRFRQLGMITTANPSTLIQLFRMLQECGEAFIRDLYDGVDFVLDREPVPRHLREIKDRRRARELDRFMEKNGALRPLDVWPELKLVAVWTGGSASAYLPSLREYIQDVSIRDHGLHASEGRMTIPIEDETASGILDITSHFFEFIPEEEISSLQPTVLEAHELIPGRSYYILLTTSSGLYRYDIHDVVECTGFYGTTPLLRFLHKGSHISNLTGEKVTESQAVQAVTAVLRQHRISLEYFTVTPAWGDPPYYQVVVDADQWPEAADTEAVANEIDQQLAKMNVEYSEKRLTNRLDPLVIRPVDTVLWQSFLNRRRRTLGGSAEQFKHPFLLPQIDFVEQLMSEERGDSTPLAFSSQSSTPHTDRP